MQDLATLLAHLYEGLDLGAVVPELNPAEGEEEWTLECPYCGRHEARAYKNNLGFIVCQQRSSCGRPMTLYGFLRDKKGLAPEEVLTALADIGLNLLDLGPDTLERCEEEERRMHLLEEAEDFFATELWGEGGASVRAYLTETKKLSGDEIRGMRLGMFTTRDRLREHLQERGVYTETDEQKLRFDHGPLGRSHVLTIPYRDPIGNMKGFAVMTLDPVYQNSRKYFWTTSRDTFFNLHEAREKLSVIAVEDPLTALTASVRGLRKVIATGGSGPSRAQLESIIPHAVTSFVFCLSGDGNNRDALSRVIDCMRSDQIGLPYVMELPAGYKDLEKFLQEHNVDVVTSMVTKVLRDGYGVAWKTRMILGKYPRDQYGEGGQRLALEEIKAFQSRLTDPLDKELVPNIVRQVMGSKTAVPEESLASFNELRHRGQLHQKLQEISQAIRRRRKGKPEEVLKTVFSLAKDLSLKHEREKPLFFPQTFREFLQGMFNAEQMRKPEELFLGFPFKKFSKVTKAINGVQPGLYVIAGRAGMGKTALMANLLYDLLESDPVTMALYGTFDDHKSTVRKRLMSIHSELPLDEIQKTPDSAFLYAKKKKAHNQLLKYATLWRLVVKDLSDMSDLDDLELDIRQRANEDFVLFIDGIHILPGGSTAPKNSDKAERMRRLVDVYRVPLFCTLELTKQGGSPGELSPNDIAAMGNFAHTADVIMMLLRDDEHKSDIGQDEPIPLTLQFEKNRLTGFTGSVQLELIGNTGIIAET